MTAKKKVTIEVATGPDAENSPPISIVYDETAPVEQQLTDHQQAILEHYGPNSAEFAEAMRGDAE